MNTFCNDLINSVREMKTGIAARHTKVAIAPITTIRTQAGLTQKQFAALLGVSIRTLQSWECGARHPSGAAKTLLRVAQQNPQILVDLTSENKTQGT